MQMKHLLFSISLLVLQSACAQSAVTDSWIEKGRSAYDSASYEEALTFFVKASEESPEAGEPWFRLGITYLELNQFKKAKESFLAALEVDSTNRDYWNDLGFTYNRMGKFKDAIPCFEKTIDLTPDIPNPHAHLGYSYLRLGQVYMAKAQLDQAKSLSDEYAKYYFYAACYFNKIGRMTDAIDHLEIAVEKGFRDKEWMKKEKSLSLIQKEIRFKKLLNSMED